MAERKCSGSNIKWPPLLVVLASSANVAVEFDSIFASGKYRERGFEKVDLIVHGKISFLFSTKYVKIISSSKFYANVHSRPPF